MAAEVRQYFLPPNFDYPPNGPIQLGRIFTSPRKLSEAINPLPEHIIPIPLDEKFETSKKKFKATVSHPNSRFKIGLFAGFLKQFLPASADLSLVVNRARESILYLDELKTVFFEPSDEYVGQALNVPEVLAKVGDPNYFTRLFMITGIKTAHGGSKASWSNTSSVGGELKAEVDLTALGVPGVSPGFTVGGGGGPTETLEWEVAGSPYVFAYRLREIQYRHGKWVSKSHDSGALYELKERQKEGQKLGESKQTPEAQHDAFVNRVADKDLDKVAVKQEEREGQKHEEAEKKPEPQRKILVNMVADEDLGIDDLEPIEKEGLVSALAFDDDGGSKCTYVSLLRKIC